MKKEYLILLILLVISCDKIEPSQVCIDYKIEIQSLEAQIDKQFQQNGKLKEQLENANQYIQLLERENDSLITKK